MLTNMGKDIDLRNIFKNILKENFLFYFTNFLNILHKNSIKTLKKSLTNIIRTRVNRIKNKYTSFTQLVCMDSLAHNKTESSKTQESRAATRLLKKIKSSHTCSDLVITSD